MSALPRRSTMSVEEYLQLDRDSPESRYEYIVNTQQQEVEVCRREKNDHWSFHTFRTGSHVELLSLNVRFPIASVYEDVEFPFEEDNAPA